MSVISTNEKPQKNFRSTSSARAGSRFDSSSSASLSRLSVTRSPSRSACSTYVGSDVISNAAPRFCALASRM
jgi:hypothetical protein